jgi:sugar (pentulose or hexulose) kinase
MGLLLGYDLGTSGVKATLLDAEAGTAVASDGPGRPRYPTVRPTSCPERVSASVR